MDSKDGRRSRVPAGTFGTSQPSTVSSGTPPADPSLPGVPSPDTRRRFPNTLVGEAGLAPSPDREPLSSDAGADSRKSFPSTLVGQPSSAPLSAHTPGAPVLAPPRWRGAQAYLDGTEPQPHMSSIPTPPPMDAIPERSGASHAPSKVTTKLGLPQPGAQSQSGRGLNPAQAAIGDAIQQMLDRQAAVSIQVEELSAEAIEELPETDFALDAVIDRVIEKDSALARDVASEGPSLQVAALAPAPSRSDATAPGDGSASASALAPASPPHSPGEAEHFAPPAAHTSPAHVAPHPKPQASPAPTTKPASPQALGAPVPSAGRPLSSSLAPTVMPARQRRLDSHSGRGVLLVVTMIVIGGGGWLVTRGGYRRPAAGPAPASTVQVPAVAVSAPPSPPPPPPTSMPGAAPQAATNPAQTSSEAPSTGRPIKPQASARIPSSSKSAPDRPELQLPDEVIRSSSNNAAPSLPTSGNLPVPAVAARPSSGELAEIPGRDDVLASLEPLRKAITECAHGQHGVAQLDITVAGTGLVTYVVVGGDFAGTAVGSCMARAARTAQFVPFSKPRFRVIYPFSL